MTGDEEVESQLRALRNAEAPVTADQVLASAPPRSVLGATPDVGGESHRERGFGRGKTRLSLPLVLGFAGLILVAAIVAVTFTVTSKGTGTGNTGLPTSSGKPKVHGTTPPSPDEAILDLVTSVPESVYVAVGLPSEIENTPEQARSQSPLRSNGKPELLYIWATYCPFCAAENWALVMALSKFGTIENVRTTHSSIADFSPNTQTLDLYKSAYSSPYFDFVSKDLATDQQAASSTACNVNGYACLQAISEPLYSLFQNLGEGSLPFLDFGNKVFQSGAGFEDEPLELKAMSAHQIAEQLHNPDSAVAKAEVGEANYFISAICKMTDNQPDSICAQAVVPKK